MKELDSFTVERLEEITELKALSFPPSHAESAALARIALAAKRAEPVSLKSAIAKFKEYNIGFPVEKLKADFVISWCLTNLTPPLNSQVPLGSWIKCSDHRPERGTDVQVYCSDTREQFVAFHIGNGEFQYAQHEDTSIACRPSHWMPLPAAPEKENG
ncbi:TPA: DUF551 domain-containing protein [Yersinia enterocolitica]|uniref:DUF551 domain-containing protein n=1 Tax=Yersinia enterocolitica TaxID=630 RepID=UPI0037074C24